MTVHEQVNRTTVMFIGAVGALVLVVFAGLVTDWFGLAAPRFQPGVQYEFSYTYTTEAPAGEINVPTRHFVVDQSTIFPALVRGFRGERAIIEDTSLPPNTFVYEMKTATDIEVGGMVFQTGYDYIETRFHMVRKEEQRLVPQVPERR